MEWNAMKWRDRTSVVAVVSHINCQDANVFVVAIFVFVAVIAIVSSSLVTRLSQFDRWKGIYYAVDVDFHLRDFPPFFSVVSATLSASASSDDTKREGMTATEREDFDAGRERRKRHLNGLGAAFLIHAWGESEDRSRRGRQ